MRDQSSSRPERRDAIGVVLSLSLSLMAAACRGVATEQDREFDFAAARSYAWKDTPRISGPEEPEDAGALALVTIQIDDELRRRGLQKIDKGSAAMLVAAQLRVIRRQHSSDAFFSANIGAELEEGTLEVEIFDRLQRRSVWRAETTERLRYAHTQMGGLSPQQVGTGERRRWPIEAMLARVLAALPIPPPSDS